MNRIKVMRIVGRLNIGGPAIHVSLLNSGLDPTRFESVLVTGVENPGEGSLLDYAQSLGVNPIALPDIVSEATLKPRDLRAIIQVYRLIRQVRPHIVHTHAAKAGFVGRVAARLARVPVVIHTYHGHVLQGYYSPLTSWALQRMEQGLALFTDQIVAVSEGVKRDLVDLNVAPSEKITVVPLGLELEPFFLSGNQRGCFRKELGMGNGVRLVGIVGRVAPIKNHHLFLESAARLTSQDPDLRFVVVGDGVLRPQLEEDAQDMGIGDRVVFTGWRRDLPAIYADLNVLVVSSDNEGTPVCAIEAMASGTPVVATRVGGVPDLIESGKTGYLVPPRDPNALAGAIIGVLQDGEAAAAVSEQARVDVRKKFSPERLIGDMEQLYQGLLDRKLR